MDADADPNDGLFTQGGLGKLTLPGVDPATDGMLFTTSNDDQSDNEGQIVTAVPFPASEGIAPGWLIAMRQDDSEYSPEVYSQAERSEFGFVYIPYTAGNLIGGSIRGTDGLTLKRAGTFNVKRASVGRYTVTIPGKTGSSGMILLQNCGSLATEPSVADDATLSYEYTGGNTFVVESHAVEPGTPDKIVTRDTDFY
ncbi:MAG: hypothetical protein ABL994_21695, partial [Verrucomicrobiales bacterium]